MERRFNHRTSSHLCPRLSIPPREYIFAGIQERNVSTGWRTIGRERLDRFNEPFRVYGEMIFSSLQLVTKNRLNFVYAPRNVKSVLEEVS